VSRAGNLPIDTVGVVDIYAPTSGPYYRLKWPEPDGTPGDTSGGRTLDGARLKAVEIDTRVRSAAGPFAVTRLDVLRNQFLADATSPTPATRGSCPTRPRCGSGCSGCCAAEAFTGFFGDRAVPIPQLQASEDFAEIPAALGVPYTYWAIGGTDPGTFAAAEQAGRLYQDIPVNHSAAFAPVVQPTLDTGTQALVVAALAWL
jgi:hippurate hydrolase